MHRFRSGSTSYHPPEADSEGRVSRRPNGAARPENRRRGNYRALLVQRESRLSPWPQPVGVSPSRFDRFPARQPAQKRSPEDVAGRSALARIRWCAIRAAIVDAGLWQSRFPRVRPCPSRDWPPVPISIFAKMENSMMLFAAGTCFGSHRQINSRRGPRPRPCGSRPDSTADKARPGCAPWLAAFVPHTSSSRRAARGASLLPDRSD